MADAQAHPQVSWLAIASLAVGAFALVTSEFMPVGLLPSVADEMGISHGRAGLMVTLPGVVAAIAAPLSVLFVSHLDRRRILLALLAMLFVSNVAVATAFGPWQLLIGRALLGIAVGSFWTIAGALGPRLRPGAQGIRASALILSGVSLGTVAGVPAGTLVGQLAGWRAAFGAGAALAVLAAVAILVLLPRIPGERSKGLASLRSLLREPAVLVRLVGALLVFLGHFGAYTYLAPFLSERTGIAEERLSALLLASGVAGFFGNIAGGWLAGRNPRLSVCVSASAIALSMALLAIFGNLAIPTSVVVTLWGFVFGMLPICLQSWMFAAAGSRLEGMQAIYVCTAQAAIGVGALAGGVIVDRSGPTGAMVGGAVAVIATVFIAGIWGRASRPSAHDSHALG
jgi:predicted MFS family arabinose efflux permease